MGFKERLQYDFPRTLYHGTSESVARAALKTGLLPREHSNVAGNWSHTVDSRKDTVYLTTAYPFHFAMCAGDGENVAVMEIDTDDLPFKNFICDEDALEQVFRGQDKLDMDMKRRTIYYRARSHLWSPQVSIAALGTCGYKGAIPPSAIGRIMVYTPEEVAYLTMRVFDGTVSTVHYNLLGAVYENNTRWLFGDADFRDIVSSNRIAQPHRVGKLLEVRNEKARKSAS